MVCLEILQNLSYIGSWMVSPKYHFYFLHSPSCKNTLQLLVLVSAGKTLKSNSSLTTARERYLENIFFWTSCSSSPNLTHARKETLIHMYSTENHTEHPQQVSPPPKFGNNGLAHRGMWHGTLVKYLLQNTDKRKGP